MSARYSFSVMCVVCHASHDNGPGEGWDTINLGDDYDFHRCAQCAAQNRRPVAATRTGQTEEDR